MPVVGVSMVGHVAAISRSTVKETLNNRQRRSIARDIQGNKRNHMLFPSRDIQLELPYTFLDEAVGFNSEQGQVTLPVSELLECGAGTLLGLSGGTDRTYVDGLKTTINPMQIVQRALRLVNHSACGDLLASARFSLEQMSDAQRKLPSGSKDIIKSFEGLSASHDAASRKLAVGALGLYGTLRAQASVDVSERISELYVDRGEEPILKDALRLSAPTSERVTWREILDAKIYLDGLEEAD